MSRYYDEAVMPDELRRNYDVYDRIRELGIELGSFEEDVVSLAKPHPVKKFVPYAGAVILADGLVHLSAQGGGSLPMSDDEERIKHGQQGAQEAADVLIRRLHWALSCGGEGDMNDVLHTVAAFGNTISPGGGVFTSGPAVMNGFSFRWQSLFGGTFSDYAANGVDPGGFSGLHSRVAAAGFDGGASFGGYMIVAIPQALARDIIRNRGWYFPLPPGILEKVQGMRKATSTVS